MDDKKQITVKSMIEKLQKHNPYLLVKIEGCDCLGDAFDVVEYEGSEVLITRTYGGVSSDFT